MSTNHKKTEDEQLATAIAIASLAHEGQHDKNGAPYILHPLRMLHRAIAGRDSRMVQIVAVLHDVIEDCSDTFPPKRLKKMGISEEVLHALEHVTKRDDESGEEGYQRFVERICSATGQSGKVARRVKILDLEDNMDVLRYGELTEKTFKRLQRYHTARKKVLAAIAERDD